MRINTENYLERIGLAEINLQTDAKTLSILQRSHLLNIPFENLDIHWKRPINLDTNKFYTKIIEQKRGVFCYELNGLLYELLKEIGFQAKIISARVSKGVDGIGEEYDHMAILVMIDRQEYLVDVGFGDFAAEPLRFVLDEVQRDNNGVFMIRRYDVEYFEVVKKNGEDWLSEYVFKDLERDLLEFSGMCTFHQTSPESHFTQRKICSIMTPDGRKTLTDTKLIRTQNGRKTEEGIGTKNDFDAILVREFGITR